MIDFEDIIDVENEVLRLLMRFNTEEDIIMVENMLHTAIGRLCENRIKWLNTEIFSYEIYDSETNEVLGTGYSEFTAINNLETLRSRYGDTLEIRWINRKGKNNEKKTD